MNYSSHGQYVRAMTPPRDGVDTSAPAGRRPPPPRGSSTPRSSEPAPSFVTPPWSDSCTPDDTDSSAPARRSTGGRAPGRNERYGYMRSASELKGYDSVARRKVPGQEYNTSARWSVAKRSSRASLQIDDDDENTELPLERGRTGEVIDDPISPFNGAESSHESSNDFFDDRPASELSCCFSISDCTGLLDRAGLLNHCQPIVDYLDTVR